MNGRNHPGLLSVGLLIVGLSCGKADQADRAATPAEQQAEPAMAPSAVASPRPERKRSAKIERAISIRGSFGGASGQEGAIAESLDAPGEPEPPGAAPESARAYFPETFLFEPLVVTDESGRASVSVRVPDRLTTWRVLGLAHTKEGSQTGALTELLGTLPVYVDLVVPGRLFAQDRIRLPIQVVNTTDQEVSTILSIETNGAQLLSEKKSRLVISGHKTVVVYAEVLANKIGALTIRAGVGKTDAVKRTVEVLPLGRKLQERRGGTLAAERSIEIVGAMGADPSASRVHLSVFPGALAVLKSELGSAALRSESVADDAYALFLAGRAPDLLRALGATPDLNALNTMGILAQQRAVRHARAPDLLGAALLLEGALAHPDNPVLARMAARLFEYLANAQRPDGTFGGKDQMPLQHLLVLTAHVTRAALLEGTPALGQTRKNALKLRANGAFERHLTRVNDPYTAAAVLASGAISGSIAERLREKVRAALVSAEDGTLVLPVPSGVVRADGQVPSQAEASALSVVALTGGTSSPGDLGGGVLASYVPGRGFGNGLTNLVCLRAVLALFRDPLPKVVSVELAIDGGSVAKGSFSAAEPRDLLRLEAKAPAEGRHRYTVRSDPPVPGLGFSLVLESYVGWPKDVSRGLDLAIDLPESVAVGRGVEAAITVRAPADRGFSVIEGLPAGVQVEERSLSALVEAGTIESYAIEEGQFSFSVSERKSTQVFRARVRLIPTFSGQLHAPTSALLPDGKEDEALHLAPVRWNIR